jgi:two-component system, LytTR family, response regulator
MTQGQQGRVIGPPAVQRASCLGRSVNHAVMNLLIVSDEPAMRGALIELCRSSRDLRVIGELRSGAEAIQHAAESHPDLLLLEAELPDMTGFEVLRALRPRQQRRTVIISAHTRDAAAAIAEGALDCLLKPVTAEAFGTSVLRAQKHVRLRIATSTSAWAGATRSAIDIERQVPLFLVGERERRLYPLDPRKIEYIESAGNYVKYHIGDAEYIARESVKRLDSLLAPAGFVRIERSLLLNIRAVSYAQPIGHGIFAFTLASGTRLHSGPAYRETILGVLPLRRRAPNGERTPASEESFAMLAHETIL